MASVRARRNERLQEKIRQMRLPLAPIYALPNGPPHALYPTTILQFWLLTESQLDSLAAYYHQLSPANPLRTGYPTTMNWDVEFLSKPKLEMSDEERETCLSDEERLAIKRRMFGKFIGLRGCETPVAEMEKRVRFIESKVERAIRRERDMMGRKWPFY